MVARTLLNVTLYALLPVLFNLGVGWSRALNNLAAGGAVAPAAD